MGAEIGKALVTPISDCCTNWAKYVFNDSQCGCNTSCCSCSAATHATALKENEMDIENDLPANV